MIKGQRAFKKIDTKIYIVFLSVIAIALFNAIFSSYTIMKSQKTTQDIVNNTNPSKDALSHLNLLLTKSRMLATNWVYMPSNTSDKASLKRLNSIEYINAKIRLQALMRNWKDKKMVMSVNAIFYDIEGLLSYQQQIMNQLSTFDDYQDPMKKFAAEETLERDVIPKTELIDSKLKEIIALQTKEASLLQDQMVAQLNTLMAVVFSIAILIISSLFFAAFVIGRSFIVPVMRVREIILEMNLGRLPEYRMGIPRNAVGEMLLALKSLIENVRRTSRFADEIGKGNFDEPFTPLSVDDVHGHALQSMRSSLKKASETEAQRAWINEGLAKLNVIMRSTTDDFNQLLDNIINMLVSYISVQQAAIFLLNNDDMEEMHIQLGAYYGLNKKVLNSKRYELKEGLVGQAIATNKVIEIENINDPFFTIDMGLMESKTCHLMIIPLATSGKVVGAISIISLNVLTHQQKDLLYKAAEPVAASLFSVRSNLVTSQLLEESRKQADELQKQEQELRIINQQLEISEEELRKQQQELRDMNDELHAKALMLEEKNVAIEDASQSLAFKAEQLEQSNKYKSAFLANMSHELRTPLNSILILAKILSDNKNNGLNEKQVEHAKVIYKSGSDLLSLINEILDLSKIEAGKVELQMEMFSTKSVAEDMQMLFAELANDKKLKFAVEVKADANVEVFNDKTRVEQIIKNLLSNAFKFTEANGIVTLKFEHALPHNVFHNKSLLAAKQVLAISVQDTGIGIPVEKQALVFEAFQQADGSTSRKYGGTGLGLAICKELAQMMGGEIQLQSTEGKGSVFTLFLPLTAIENHVNIRTTNHETAKQQQTSNSQGSSVMLRDDKATITATDKRILIIEDDHVFAQMLVNQCHQNGMKAIVAMQGDEGLKYANDYEPDAIILDMRLPVMDGWTVLQQIKTTEKLKHIPVHVVTSMDKKNMSMEMGADSYFQKPANNNDLSSLMNHITDNIYHKHIRIAAWGKSEAEMQKIIQRVKEKEENVSVECFSEAETCIASLQEKPGFRCVIVEGLATHTITAELKNQLHVVTDEQNIPIVYFDGDPGECLDLVSSVIHPPQPAGLEISKTTQHFLNSIKASVENNHSAGLRMQEILKGKTVLVADDDMRNIYSMTNILENEEMKVICATNGKEALQLLSEHQDIDIVLMDIMMPEMNGYEAMSEIRKIKKYADLPVIAVTAKAMTGDREKCIEAGASDYITKPVNIELLVSVMQAWLYK